MVYCTIYDRCVVMMVVDLDTLDLKAGFLTVERNSLDKTADLLQLSVSSGIFYLTVCVYSHVDQFTQVLWRIRTSVCLTLLIGARTPLSLFCR